MSYLVDALKKAERDRHARREANLRTAAATDAPVRRRPGARLLVAVVVILVLANAVVLFRLWTPAAPNEADPVTSAHPARVEASTDRPIDDPSGSRAARRLVERRREQQSSNSQQPGPSARTSPSSASSQRSHRKIAGNRDLASLSLSPQKSAAGTPDSRTRDHTPDQRADPSQSTGAGSVRYADMRLSADSASPAPGPTSNKTGRVESDAGDALPNQAQIDGAPQIEINGQLYSSVPGRSFILVDGRRYHDGEKLPAGPAIERITPTGAILRYRSKRYHVAGPGGG